MSTAVATLHGFAYGEHLEDLSGRSLGFRLLAPVEPAPWRAEVETLARQFQAAPYPDHWPPCDLFCSVLLGTGERLIALARYGLVDHTPNSRRGGLELIGVVGPADIDPTQARAVYEWLKKRRSEMEELRTLGGTVSLADAVAQAPPPVAPSDPTPVVPVRIWHEGAFLFAATTPSDPDHRLSLLEQGGAPTWQWLPLVGADFPLAQYSRRGPVIAWTPHLAGVALKLDRKDAERPALAPAPSTPLRGVVAILLAVVLVLVGMNLWQTSALERELRAEAQAQEKNAESLRSLLTGREGAANGGGEGSEKFAEKLYELLQERGGSREWRNAETQLLSQYQQIVRDPRFRDLKLKDSNVKGQMAVGAVGVMSQRTADRIKEVVKQALLKNKVDAKVAEAIGDAIHDQLINDLKESP